MLPAFLRSIYYLLFAWASANVLAIIGVFVAALIALVAFFATKFFLNHTEKAPWLHRLPGYRTKNAWKMAIASFAYILALTYASKYIVDIQAKTLYLQTDKTVVRLRINPRPTGEITPTPLKPPPAQPFDASSNIVYTPDKEIIIPWIKNKLQQLANLFNFR